MTRSRALRGGDGDGDADGFAASLAGRRVTVAGIGVSGASAARVLAGLGARVTVVDGSNGPPQRARAAELASAAAAPARPSGASGASTRSGLDVRLGAEAAATLPEGTELVVTSPGWRPDSPLFAAAGAAGVEVIGDVELAWRLRRPGAPPWLAVTGTNGKTTTVRMLASMLAAAGHRVAAVGNIGTPLIDVVLGAAAEPGDEAPVDPDPQVLAVELSSYQLHYAPSVRAHAAAVLNLAPDHLDWHGSMAAYAADKARIYEGAVAACVYNAADPATEELVRAAEVTDGCRAVGFTLEVPAPGELGVVGDLLVDRAFVDSPRQQAAELAQLADIAADQPAALAARPAPHTLANALAAAALARAYGVPAAAVRDGLRAFRPEPHRIAHVARVADIAYVDDSKATNPHAARASLAAYPSVVWIAGGLAKGADFDELVAAEGARLAGAVLLGADRALLAGALARHAPGVPVVEVDRTDPGAMAAAVNAAARLATPGDTVLLAPACASWDMFANYGERGDAFAAAVRELAADQAGRGER